MLYSNYLKAAWNNIICQKLYSAINILGLTLGLTASILIFIFVRDEISYDGFWINADNIYRTHVTISPPGRAPIKFVKSAGPIIHPIKRDFPQIEFATRVAQINPSIQIGNNFFSDEITLVDQDIINIFDFKAISGDINNALTSDSSIVLNETLAVKYFGSQAAVGNIITINFDAFTRDFVVSAVIEDIPENSQLKLDAMVLINENDWREQRFMFEAWFNVNVQMYYTIKNGNTVELIDNQMPNFIDRHFPERANRGPEFKNSDIISISSMNIKDLHLKAEGIGEYKPRGNYTNVIIFSAVAILIIFVAVINFINLSTARSNKRAKEVSVRKVMGASRKDLIIQFLSESIFLCLIALFFTLLLVELLLPAYNFVLNKDFLFNYNLDEIFWIILLIFIVGILGGIYPAFVLSSFRPAQVLKSNRSSETGFTTKLRTSLVIIQFTASIVLAVCAAVIYGQMLFANNTDLGYNKENLLIVKNLERDAASDNLPLLVDEIGRFEQVTNISWSNFTPGNQRQNNSPLRAADMSIEQSLIIGNRGIGYSFFNTFEIPLLAGREYAQGRNDKLASIEDIKNGEGGTNSLIVNQSILQKLNLGEPEQAIGQLVYSNVADPDGNLEIEYEIIGVVADTHFEDLKTQVRPEIYFLNEDDAETLYIRYSGNANNLIQQIRMLWEREIPSVPFTYDYVTNIVDEQYQEEQRIGYMFAAFSLLAILIACLGLYGLANFTAEQRTKEIGIRKIMGADVRDIVKLLIWQFSKPILIANALAWPIAFYFMTKWLESFPYRIESYTIIIFCIVSGFIALIIAWITVASNSISTAKANPINALREE